MKVSIITRHAIANYGSILQSIATEKIFQKLGLETEIINYVPENEKIENLVESYIKNSSFWNKNFLTRQAYRTLQKNNIYLMNKAFRKFQEDYLNLSSQEYHSKEELVQNKPKADLFCTGSDQVWGAIGSSKYDLNYFLDFLSDEDVAISYAASFGKNTICEELISQLPELTQKYKEILVREDSAVDILQESGVTNVKQVIDPTLFLTQDDWNNICVNERLVSEDYILIYQLHHNKNLEKYAKKLAKATGKKLVRINTSKYFKYKVGEFVYLPTPGEFLSYIKYADLVLTDSFHGTCFSIIYNKDFIDILPGVTGTRITSILKLFGLENRLVTDYNDLSVLDESIDFEKVNELVKSEQTDSLQKLKETLDKCNISYEK